MLSYNNDEDISFKTSIKVCQLWGIKKKLFFFVEKKTIEIKKIKTNKLIKDKLVKEKSKLNNFIENIEII